MQLVGSRLTKKDETPDGKTLPSHAMERLQNISKSRIKH